MAYSNLTSHSATPFHTTVKASSSCLHVPLPLSPFTIPTHSFL